MKKVAIIGAGGFGREVLDIFLACNQVQPEFDVCGFIVESEYARPGEIVRGIPVLGGFDWLEKHSQDVFVICSIGAPHKRRRLVRMAQQAGARFCSVVHPDADISPETTFGENVIINKHCLISSSIHIGNHVQLNAQSLLGHDVVLKDFVTVSPGVMISGAVTIEEGAFIGIGAIIIEKLTIGAWSIVGAGSVVIRPVAENTTVVGNPGKVVKELPAGWHCQIDESTVL